MDSNRVSRSFLKKDEERFFFLEDLLILLRRRLDCDCHFPHILETIIVIFNKIEIAWLYEDNNGMTDEA